MTTITARVARFQGDGKIEFGHRELPALADGHVRLAVTHCGLCGSDKRLLQAGASQVPGHEIVGTVTAAAGVTDHLPGTRGAVYIPLFCGGCEACTDGWTNRCENLERLVGWQVDGGFAEVVDVPARNLIVLPEDVPNDLGVLLLDTVGTAAHALRQALTIRPDGRALVIGCGPLGLGCVVVATALGIDHVDATDPAPARLAAARRLGAGQADDSRYDIVVEASGSTPGRQRAVDAVRPGGVVLMLGESNDPWSMPATPSWRRTDVAYLRTFYFPMRDVSANLELVRAHRDRLVSLIDVRAPLDDLQTVFEDFTAGHSLKPLVYVPTPKGTDT